MEKKIVTSLSEATRSLICSTAVANRKQYDYDLIASVDKELAARVQAFFQQWPMYNDGLLHRKMRTKILSGLRSHIYSNREAVRGYLKKFFLRDEITLVDIQECVLFWHANYFGIDVDADAHLRCASEALIDLVIFRNFSKISEARRSLEYVSTFLDSANFDEEGLIGLLVRDGNQPGAVMNLLVDSYTPMTAAAGNVLFRAGQMRSRDLSATRDRENFILQALAEAPPFGLITRMVPEGNEVKWLVVDVLQCNAELVTNPREGKPLGLTFGAGPHTCLGYRATMDFLDDLLVAATTADFSRNFVVSGSLHCQPPVSRIENFHALRI